MKIIHNRNVYRGGLIFTFILLNVFILLGIGKILSFFNEGADRKQMLHLEVVPVDNFSPKVLWTKLENPGRIMEPNSLKKLEKHYLFGVLAKNQALKNNLTTGLDDFYTDNPLNEIKKIIAQNKNLKASIDGTTLSHQLSLEFYSDDGQLAVITDKCVVEYQNLYQDDKFIASVKDTVAYKNVLLLEDGFWKSRQIVKITPEPFIPEKDTISVSDYTVKNKIIYKKNQPFVIKGINYYPQKTPWEMYGEKYDEKIIASDFELIKNSNLNTIRIFVPFKDFGEAEIDENKLNKLVKTVELAQENDLSVIVTLFDFYGNYSPDNWTITHRHAEKIIKSLNTFSNILAWDIKNEPDLDYNSRGDYNVIPWIESLEKLIRIHTKQLITVGCYNGEKAVEIEKYVDFISFHFYDDINEIKTTYEKIDSKTKKPIVVQEFGLSSTQNFWNWFGNNQEDQKNHHRICQKFFKEKNAHFVSWTLYDFDAVPDAVAGKKFWIKHKQKNFGFIDRAGKKKPSFQFISN
jgi:hypothetical protein